MIKFVPRRRISNNSPEGRGRGRSLEGFTRAEIPITDRHETGASSRRRLSQGSPRLLSIFSSLSANFGFLHLSFFLSFFPLHLQIPHFLFLPSLFVYWLSNDTYQFEVCCKLKHEFLKIILNRYDRSFNSKFSKFLHYKNVYVFIFHISIHFLFCFFSTKQFFSHTHERKIGKKYIFVTN